MVMHQILHNVPFKFWAIPLFPSLGRKPTMYGKSFPALYDRNSLVLVAGIRFGLKPSYPAAFLPHFLLAFNNG